jgi:simple sugar transport system substrate-binding protein
MTPGVDRAQALRVAAAAAAAAAFPAGASAAADGQFPQPHPRWRFVFINHALTNPFFVPAMNGSQDACALLGATSVWTGSVSSDVGEMVKAMRRAIDTRASGIALSIIDPTAFNGPTAMALERGIPVVAYNADGGKSNKRLAYIGQDLYESGLEFGARIVGLVGSGDVFIFIATPGQQNIQPRVDGALDAIRDSGRPIHVEVVATGVDVRVESRKIERTYLEHKRARGLFAVDAGSTQGVAEVMRRHKLHAHGVRAGGYDLLPETLTAIRDGHLDFTIDQQPYLQGFLPTLQLFLYRYSSGLVAPANTNTGLNFVTRRNVHPFLTTKSRFEGSSEREVYPVTS